MSSMMIVNLEKPRVKCKALSIYWSFSDDKWRAILQLLDPHPELGIEVGERITTSSIRTIDFDERRIETQNTVYRF